jgi:hypothetical protein
MRTIRAGDIPIFINMILAQKTLTAGNFEPAEPARGDQSRPAARPVL